MDIVERLKEFVEVEMRSGSMDIAGITPEYVARMWGAGSGVSIDEIAAALAELKKEGFLMK